MRSSCAVKIVVSGSTRFDKTAILAERMILLVWSRYFEVATQKLLFNKELLANAFSWLKAYVMTESELK